MSILDLKMKVRQRQREKMMIESFIYHRLYVIFVISAFSWPRFVFVMIFLREVVL